MKIKPFFTTVIAVLGLLVSSGASAAIQDGQFVSSTPKVGFVGRSHQTHAALQSANPGKRMLHAAASADHSFQAASFGFLEGADGETWYYTMSNQQSETFDYCYASSTVTVFDGKHQQKGTFSIEIPDTMRVNMIEPFGLVTNKLFDTNSMTYEVTVFFHEVTPDYTGRQFVRVYGLDGTMIDEHEGDGMVVSSPINEWTPYQRYVTVHNSATDPLMTEVEIFRPATWGETGIQSEHVFCISSLLVNYMDAPFFNFFADGANSCFVLSHYEKSFDVRDENGQMQIDPDSYMPVFTPDNSFVIETFDRQYNRVDSFGISTAQPSEDVMVRMMGLGAFSNIDINKGIFSDDNRLSYIVMYEDVAIDTEYTYSFVAFSHEGEQIGVIGEGIGDFWNHLSSIPGCEEQFVFLESNIAETLYTVDLPSLRTNYLPVSLDDRSISTNLDRYPSVSDAEGYRYVTGINAADVDDNNNVISLFAHMNSDGSLHHFVRFNMGPLAQTFTPLVNNQSLDPYLFNSDSDREYIFFSKVRDSFESTQGRNVLFIGNEKGEIVRTFDPAQTEEGDIWTAAIMNYGTTEASLLINYYDWDTDMNRVDFYGLPFTSFAAGGDGTEANPYLVSSAGDLQLIERHPSAFYRLACDFDAEGYPVSIADFSGTLDGDGHTISNLNVTSDNYYAGLFGNATGATVRNLKLYNPSVVLGAANQSFGLLSAYAVESRFERIVVSGLSVTGDIYASPLGGLVGMATAGTVVSECLIDGCNIAGGTWGGLVGEMRTSSLIEASAVIKAVLNGYQEVGGIVGVVGTGCMVKDCFVNASISAYSYVGGIVGRLGVNGSRASVIRCVVDGCVVRDNGERHSGFSAIAGYVEPAWTKSDTVVCVSKSVVSNSYILTNADGAAEGSSIHAIAGYTKANEIPEKPEDDMNEYGLKDNYVYHDIMPESESAYFGGGSDANSVEGLTVVAEVLTPQLFWQNLGYAFDGQSAAAPWQYEEGRLPSLWIMDESNAPSSLPAISTRPFESAAPLYYNLSGQRVAVPHGLVIVDGKKQMIR